MLYLLLSVSNPEARFTEDLRITFHSSKTKAIKAYTVARKTADANLVALNLYDDAESLEVVIGESGDYVIEDIATKFQTTKEPIRSWSNEEDFANDNYGEGNDRY